jgi:AcrR family transcriptional regulator
MAQILKEHVRQDILEAAKNEFLEHGIYQASMRDIAKGAYVTVGNVYRYFKNKEALADAIINPTLDLLNQTIFDDVRVSDDLVTKSTHERMAYFQSKIHSLSDGFLHVFQTHQTECLILLNHSRFYNQMVDWINELILMIVNRWVFEKQSIEHVNELCEMLSEAIMSGLARGLLRTCKPYYDQPLVLHKIINMYLHLFTMMIEAGEANE